MNDTNMDLSNATAWANNADPKVSLHPFKKEFWLFETQQLTTQFQQYAN